MSTLSPNFISAICTPLTQDDRLHEAGLEAHLNDQWNNGIHGVLVAGTMGLMQLLTDQTYQSLARQSIAITKGRGQVLIGAGDASLARTLGRVEFLNSLSGVDGVVVLTPYFIQFSQPELIDYYTPVANASKPPIYLYDLPQRTRSKIELATVQTLAKHPNIKGIKCSDDFVSTRLLIDAVGKDLQVVVASPLIADMLLKFGYESQLDGIFAVVPAWIKRLGQAAIEGNWELASEYQRKITAFAALFHKYEVLPMVTAILNARGMPGRFAPRPYRMLDEALRTELLNLPFVKQLIAEHAV